MTDRMLKMKVRLLILLPYLICMPLAHLFLKPTDVEAGAIKEKWLSEVRRRMEDSRKVPESQSTVGLSNRVERLRSLSALLSGGPDPQGTRGVQAPTFKISEIGLERDWCFGKCPVYTLIIRQDGTVYYKGETNVLRVGEYTGRISAKHYVRLAQFIVDAGYFDLGEHYATQTTDSVKSYTMVVVNGKPKIVVSQSSAMPDNLWAIQQLIDNVRFTTVWKPMRQSVAD